MKFEKLCEICYNKRDMNYSFVFVNLVFALLPNHFREKISQLKSIKIIEDSSLSCDGTIVESPLSRVDARISSQINEIAEQLMNGASDELQQE